jgi:hypothetical protein
VTWLNPSAAFALVMVAAPLLIHLLVHRHAEPFPFPTLRFIRPTRLAAIRRHVLEDIALLAIRIAIVAAAVAAVAGPLMTSAARRAQWNARVVRAVVVHEAADATVSRSSTPHGTAAFRTREFKSRSIADGLHRALAWLNDSPPARRELAIAGPLTAGSVRDTDMAAIPADVGIRFERLGTLPNERTVEAAPLLAPAGISRLTATVSARGTSVRTDFDATKARWPIEIVAPEASRPAVDAAVQAVASQFAPQPAPDRPVKVLVADRQGNTSGDLRAEAIHVAWMADAAAAIARDADLQDEAARVGNGFNEGRFRSPPWVPLAFAANGQTLVSAAASAEFLLVATAGDAEAVIMPVLLRSIAVSIAPRQDPASFEVVPLADSTLRAWTRDAGPVRSPRIDTVERDDRRWLWVAVLVLLAVELWMRRGRPVVAGERKAEEPRVA